MLKPFPQAGKHLHADRPQWHPAGQKGQAKNIPLWDLFFSFELCLVYQISHLEKWNSYLVKWLFPLAIRQNVLYLQAYDQMIESLT